MNEYNISVSEETFSDPRETLESDTLAWQEVLLSKGTEYWQDSADRQAGLAERYAERAEREAEGPEGEDWTKLSHTYSKLAIISRGLADEAAARTANTNE